MYKIFNKATNNLTFFYMQDVGEHGCYPFVAVSNVIFHFTISPNLRSNNYFAKTLFLLLYAMSLQNMCDHGFPQLPALCRS